MRSIAYGSETARHNGGDDVEAPRLPDLWLHPVIGMVAIIVFMGGFLAWASLAPLASSAPATGIVKTLGNRRLIQNQIGRAHV